MLIYVQQQLEYAKLWKLFEFSQVNFNFLPAGYCRPSPCSCTPFLLPNIMQVGSVRPRGFSNA